MGFHGCSPACASLNGPPFSIAGFLARFARVGNTGGATGRRRLRADHPLSVDIQRLWCFHMVNIWLLYGYYMVIIWLLYGSYMVLIWFLYGYYMVLIWLLYGYYMVNDG